MHAALQRIEDAPADLCGQFYDAVVRGAACVLGGAKPAALFNFIPRGTPVPAAAHALPLADTARRLAAGLSARFADADLHAAVMFATAGRALLFVSRPSRLETLIAEPEPRAFLARAGYAVDCHLGLVASLRERLQAYERAHASGAPCKRDCIVCTFPHEVGLLLGYPLEDVRGFIENGGRGAVAVGPWKAYGDADEARRRWDALAACRASVIRNYANGTPFEALIA